MHPFRLAVVGYLILAATAQTSGQGFSWFPDSSLFLPLLVNHEEPRMSLEQEIGSSRLNVGIGSTLELFQTSTGIGVLQVGGDFFAYALANDYQGFRLKIDAVDGYFGLHGNLQAGRDWSFRFRAMHLSAHFVDGHYNPDSEEWRDGIEPIPFSRNFGELVAAWSAGETPVRWRIYAGVSCAVVVKPNDIQPWAGLAGVECMAAGSPYVYAAVQMYLMGVPTYVATNSLEAGVRFGRWSGTGVRFALKYQNGLEYYGQYYNRRREFVSIAAIFEPR
jgi:hypothetical protein